MSTELDVISEAVEQHKPSMCPLVAGVPNLLLSEEKRVVSECAETLLDALIDVGYAGRELFECEHDEHWATVPADTGWLDWNDAPAECRWLQAHNPCVLPTGHGGDHAYDWPITRGVE